MYTLIPALTVLESMMYNMWCYSCGGYNMCWSSWPDFIDKLRQRAEVQIRQEDKALCGSGEYWLERFQFLELELGTA